MLLQVLRSLGMGSAGAGQAAQQQQELSDEEQWTEEEEEEAAAGVSDDEVCGAACRCRLLVVVWSMELSMFSKATRWHPLAPVLAPVLAI